MFVDFPEVVIIFGVALVVLGPKKLPGAAAQVGKWVGRARAMARQFREQLEQEVSSVQSALDLNAKPGASGKASAKASPEPDRSAAPEPLYPEPPDYSATGAVTDLQPPATSWHPEYGTDSDLAPYGDPNLIPRPEEGDDGQLSLELGQPATSPGARAPDPSEKPVSASSDAPSAELPGIR